MICPHDQSGLVARVHDGNAFHHCDRCQGLWIAPLALKGMLSLPVESLWRLGPAPSVRRPKSGEPLACPAGDGAVLQMKCHDRIEIDFCPVCHGVWLDAGEIEEIHRRYRAGRARFAPENTGPGAPGHPLLDGIVEGAIEAAFRTDVAGDLIGIAGKALGKAPEMAGEAYDSLIAFLGDALGDAF